MLDTVKAYIRQMPKESFYQYYMKYVMSVQDKNMETELKLLKSKNVLGINSMDRLINHVAKEVNIYDSYCKLTDSVQ